MSWPHSHRISPCTALSALTLGRFPGQELQVPRDSQTSQQLPRPLERHRSHHLIAAALLRGRSSVRGNREHHRRQKSPTKDASHQAGMGQDRSVWPKGRLRLTALLGHSLHPQGFPSKVKLTEVMPSLPLTWAPGQGTPA